MPVFEMPLCQMKTYQGCSPRPSDFDAYWASALHSPEMADLSYTLVPADFSAKGTECFDLWFTGVRGARIHCKFLRPRAVPQPMPALVFYHGYTHHAGDWTEKLPYVYHGMAVLAMDCRGQGGLSEDVFAGKGPTLFGHVVRGVMDDNPQNLYYRDVYLDAAKVLRILISMDGIDASRIAVTGPSQGGALSLAAAALIPEVKLCAPVYPFLCDFRRVWQMDLISNAYEGIRTYFRKLDPTHEREEDFFIRLGYIDIQNLTPAIRARILWQTALLDTTCPPSAQFAAYNKLRTDKRMLLYHEYAHEQLPGANDHIFSFVCKHL